MKRPEKIVVLGLDGATYRVLDRLIGWGVMPNLDLIFKKGIRGDLVSTLPPMTGTAWASFATGKNPAKHSCFNFYLPTQTLNDSEIISSSSIAGRTFYEILEAVDKKCILINWPVSWPPRLKKGVMVGSLLTTADDFFYPKNLIEKIPELASYQLFPDFFLEYQGTKKEYLEELRQIEKTRFLVAQKLFAENWDFFFLLFSSTDWLQHRFLNELLDSSLKKNSALVTFFKEIDNYLGWFLKNLPRQTFLFLLSDHGFRVYSGYFYLNRWLEESGYLKTAFNWKGISQKHDAAEQRVKVDYQKGFLTNLKRQGLITIFKSPFLYLILGWLMRFLNRFFPTRFERDLTDPADIGLGVDLAKTRAYSVLGNLGQIYLNRRGRFRNGILGQAQAENLKKELVAKLKKLKDPLTGKKAAKAVYTKEEIFTGPFLEKAPEIILEAGEFWIKSSLHAQKIFSHQSASSHSRDGIFACFYPGLKRADLAGVQPQDLAPTILNLWGIKVPEEMDGKILKLA